MNYELFSEANPDSPGGEIATGPEVTDHTLRQQLRVELEKLIERLQAMTPDYVPPAFRPGRFLRLLEKGADRFSARRRLRPLKRLRSAINEDLLDIDTWKGVWYMVNYTLEYQGDILKRRLTGDYETDIWGKDQEFLEVIRPFLDFLYRRYWRVETYGLENIPADGPALLIGNHAGKSPWEGAMVLAALLNDHPAERLVRSLYAVQFSTVPFLASIFQKMGGTMGTVENGRRLLEAQEVVAVYPDGYQSIARHGNRLHSFGWPEAIRIALQTQAPIIPMAIIGAEETYAALGNASLTTRLTGRPHPILSPQSPWFGPISLLPPPAKWIIDFSEPLTPAVDAADAAADTDTIASLVEAVQDTLAEMLEEHHLDHRPFRF